MPSSFDLTFEINARLASGAAGRLERDLRQATQGVTVPVTPVVSPTAKVALGELDRGLRAVRESAASASSSATQAGTAFERMGSQVRTAAEALTGFVLGAVGVVKVAGYFKDAIGQALQFERQMLRVAQVGDDSRVSVAAVGAEITRLSTSLGVSSASLADAALKFRQAGFSLGEVRTALEAVAKADLAPSFGGIQKTADALVAIRSQFKLGAGELEGRLSSINAVANRFAVNAQDIAKGVRTAGGAFRTAGGDVNEFVSIFSTVASTTRQPADTIASALRTIFVRAQRPQTIEHLRNLGVELHHTADEAKALGQADLAGTFVGPLAAVQRLGEATRGLRSTDPRFAAIAEENGGYRQIEKVIPLLQEQTKLQEALNVARSGDVSLTTSAEKAQGALAVQASKVKEEFLELGRNVLESPGFRGFLKLTLDLTSSLVSLANAARPLLPLLGAFAAVRIGQQVAGLGRGLFGRPPGLATGGVVPGYGGGDTVPAMLTPGEFVINRQAADAIGRANLHRLNARRYATGGPVDPLGDDAYQRELAAELAGTKAARADLISKGFLSPDSAEVLAAQQAQRGLTGRQTLARDKAELRRQRLAEYEARVASGRGIFEDVTVEALPTSEHPDAVAEALAVAQGQSQAGAPTRSGGSLRAFRRQQQAAAGGSPPPPPPPSASLLEGPGRGRGVNRSEYQPDGPTRRFLGLGDLPTAAAAAGTSPAAFNELVAAIRKDAQAAGRLYDVLGGTSKVLVEFQGEVARLRGFSGEVSGHVRSADRERLRRGRRPLSGPELAALYDPYASEGVSQDIFGLRPEGDDNAVYNSRRRGRRRRAPADVYGTTPILNAEEEARRYVPRLYVHQEGPAAPPPPAAPVRGRFGRLYERFGPGGVNERLGLAGLYAANIGGAYLGDALGRAAGTAEGAVAGGSEEAYGRYRGASGAATGAVTGTVFGATVGSAVPVIGTGIGAAVGAAAGALYGFVSSLREAEGDVRQAKINTALTEFGDRLRSIRTAGVFGHAGGSVAAAVAAKGLYSSLREEIAGKSADEATGLFGGFDAAKYGGVYQKNLRGEFGRQLPDINKELGAFADDLAKNNVKGNLDDLAKKLRDGNNGLNDELLRLIARLRGLPVETVVGEFRKQIQQGQSRAAADERAKNARTGEDRNINAFGRLAVAVDTATSSLTGLGQQAKSLAGLFEGQVRPTHVAGGGDVLKNVGTGDRVAFGEATGVIAAAGGGVGRQFAESAEAVNKVANVLPTVLTRSLAQGPLNAEDFVTSTQRLLPAALGHADGKLPPELLRAVTTAVAGLQRGDLKFTDIVRETQTDATKFTDRLLGPLTGPIKDAGPKIAGRLEAEANRFIDGLTQTSHQLQVINEGYHQLARTQVAGYRTQVGFAAEAAGRQHEGVGLVPLSVLDYPFQSRQESLTGLRGGAANDPGLLGGRLRRVSAGVLAATAAQQEAFNKTGGVGPAFEAAAGELARLKAEAFGLQQALRHLADASERNAGAQEKLAKIQQDKDSRLGFFDKLIHAGPDERQRIDRGLILSNRANNLGSLRGLTNDDQRLVLDTLSSLGNTKLTGLKGQPNAADLRQNLLRDFGGAAAQDPANRAEEADLKKVIAENVKTAEAAQKEYLDNQSKLQGEFFANLQATQAQFLKSLSSELLGVEVAKARVGLGQAAKEEADARKAAGYGATLRKVGVTTDEQAKALRENRPLYEELAGARVQVESERKVRAERADEEARGLLGRQSRDFFGDRGVSQLASAALQHDAAPAAEFSQAVGRITDNPADVQAVNRRFRELSRERLAGVGVRGELFAGDNVRKLNEDPRAKDILLQSFRDAVNSVTTPNLGKAEGRAREAEARLRGRGLNPDLVNAGNSKDVFEALDKLNGKSLGEADRQVAATAQKFQELQAVIDRLAAGGQGPGGRQGFASGGPVSHNGVPGGPKGSDTVPAWLSPGEYVVNAAATKKNRAVLEAMNHGRSLHLAGGGPITREGLDRDFRGAQLDFLKAGLADPRLGEAFEAHEVRGRNIADIQSRLQAARTKGDRQAADVLARQLREETAKQGQTEAWLLNNKAYGAYREAHGNRQAGLQEIAAREARQKDEQMKQAAGLVTGVKQFFTDFGEEKDRADLEKRKAERAKFKADRDAREAFKQRGRDIEADLPGQAAANPGGVSAQQLLTRQVRELQKDRLAKLFDRAPHLLPAAEAGQEAELKNALALNYYGGQARALGRQQRQAHYRDPGAAFGLGRPGMEAQLAIASGAFAREGALNRDALGQDPFVGDLLKKRRAELVGTQQFPLKFATGGMVPGTYGGVADTVPAYLSQGEYVMSRAAVRAVGADNLSRVNYLAQGGAVTTPSPASGPPDLSGFSQASQALAAAFNTFGGNATALTAALTGFPKTLAITGSQRVEVIVNGQESLARMMPAVQEGVQEKIDEGIRKLLKNKFPDA